MTQQPLAIYAPQLFRGTTRVFTVSDATSLKFICPLCSAHHIILPLQRDLPLQRGRPILPRRATEPDAWRASGQTVYDITLTPSVHVDPGCGFHAMITHGRVQKIRAYRGTAK